MNKLKQLAKRYIWWMKPDDTLARPERVIGATIVSLDSNNGRFLPHPLTLSQEKS